MFIPYAVQPAVEAEVQALVDQGDISISSSEWNAPIVLVKRKKCYLLPQIEDILYQVSQSKRFSSLDSRSEYHQVPLNKGFLGEIGIFYAPRTL